jgi:Transposase DDE domain
VRWGSFSVYGVKLHLLCATNRVPLSYELTAANVAVARLTEELITDVALLGGEGLAPRLFGDLAYRSEALEGALAEAGIVLVTERSRQHGKRQQVEIALATLKREFRPRGDVADHTRGPGDEDRGEGDGLHLRLSHKSAIGSSSRPHQGVVGTMNLTTFI